MSSADLFVSEPGRTLILSGAVAASRGAFEAGVGLVLTYPGSPVVESFEALADRSSPLTSRAHVVINEHVAYHRALGYSLAGGRSLMIMKHVGMNVASDPAHYSGYTGVRGGMVVLVGADPGATCSTGEFDVRFLSLHTHLPILEPGDFQETVDATRGAFELSEHLLLPVMVIVPARLCYGMGTVTTGPVAPPRDELSFARTPDLTVVGQRAVERHRLLMEKIERLRELPPDATLPGLPADRHRTVPSRDLIVASGVIRDLVLEAMAILGVDDRVSVYAPALTYPLSGPRLLGAMGRCGCERVLFVEDLEGFLETQATATLVRSRAAVEVHGKDVFRPWGVVGFREVLDGLRRHVSLSPAAPDAAPGTGSAPLPHTPLREGTFCPGCPHRAFFDSLRFVLREGDVLGGDIGCSSLPPHYPDWLTCMNSGTSIASGVGQALVETTSDRGRRPRVVSLVGDSTLFHSGLQTIIDCARRDSDQICFVLDNSWTAMTGHQSTPGTPRDLKGDRIEGAVDIPALLGAAGVRRLFTVDPLRVSRMRRLMMRLLEEPGFSCVVVRRECKLQVRRRGAAARWTGVFGVVEERCRRCNRCYSVLTCPAIDKLENGQIVIDPDLCGSCSLCHQTCPNGAIVQVRVRAAEAGPRRGRRGGEGEPP